MWVQGPQFGVYIMGALDSQLQGHDLDKSALLEASLGSLKFLIETFSTLN